MTNQEAIDVMFNEWKCIDRNDGIHCDRKCESCDLVMDVGIIREAFNMAISALQAQDSSKPTAESAQNVPKEYLISRKAAIDALNRCTVYHIILPPLVDKEEVRRALASLPSAEPELNFDEWCTDCKEYDHKRHCCPRWNRVIKQTLKDAQPEPQWIPVSERVPEANGRYLVTRGLNACSAMWNRVYIINYSNLMGLKSVRIWWDGNVGKSDFERIDDVIAWMPLPEPYRAERRTDDLR